MKNVIKRKTKNEDLKVRTTFEMNPNWMRISRHRAQHTERVAVTQHGGWSKDRAGLIREQDYYLHRFQKWIISS